MDAHGSNVPDQRCTECTDNAWGKCQRGWFYSDVIRFNEKLMKI